LPTPGLGTDRRIRSILARCLAKICSLSRVAWPFLLGEEDDGTLPLGRALRTKLAKELTLLLSQLLLLLSCALVLINNFLPSIFDINAANEKKKMKTTAPKRAIKERMRDDVIWVFWKNKYGFFCRRKKMDSWVWFEAEKRLKR